MTTPSAGGPSSLPLKPGESPEDIATEQWEAINGDEETDVARLAAALKAYGDRRGEEERAKALREAWVVVNAAMEDAWELQGAGMLYQTLREHREKLSAAAPSGDAKGTTRPGICPECGGRGWPTALDNCATCHGDPLPTKGTK